MLLNKLKKEKTGELKEAIPNGVNEGSVSKDLLKKIKINVLEIMKTRM